MDYNNKDWYYSPQTYPFYAPYQMQMQAGLPMQMQGNYLKEMEYEKDLDRMRNSIRMRSKRYRNMWTKNVTEWSMREA